MSLSPRLAFPSQSKLRVHQHHFRPSDNHRRRLLLFPTTTTRALKINSGGSNKERTRSGTSVIRTGVTWGVEIFGRYLHLHVALPIKIIISSSSLVPAQIAGLRSCKSPLALPQDSPPSALAGIVGAGAEGRGGLEAAVACRLSRESPPVSCFLAAIQPDLEEGIVRIGPVPLGRDRRSSEGKARSFLPLA